VEVKVVSLNSVKSSVQEVAEAISAVLHVDVTIIDQNFKRIAATGEYKNRIGNKIPSKCLFENVIKEKTYYYAHRNNNHENMSSRNLVCNNCEAKETCTEFATIGYPIMMGDTVMGIIGINVFDEEQYDIISKNFESMIIFLNKLSTLLVGNIVYHDTIKKLKIHTEETNHIIDCLSDGIICLDNKGTIKYINKKGEKLLNINESDVVDCSIKNLINDIELNNFSKEYKGIDIDIKGRKQSFLLKSNPITCGGEKVSNIIEIRKKSDEVKAAYKLFANSKTVRFEDIIGESNNFINVKVIAKNISKTDSTVLLTGESGTGKELFARAIHYESNREDCPFIAINCASIPDNLLESELFGFEGGSFSGARREGQMGKFELANGGTLFLDEIGDLPLHLQPKILRVLQEHSFRKIGGKEEICVDVRIIAATNRNLDAMVKNGQFREDLYYRLKVIPIVLPSLRERGEDIFLLSDHLLHKFCCRFDLPKKVLGENAKEIFLNYNWPGNIRELENVIEYLVNVSKGGIVYSESLPETMKLLKASEESIICNKDLKTRVEEFEAGLLLSLIKKYGDDAEGKSSIIRELGIDLSTLYRKLKKYNLQK